MDTKNKELLEKSIKHWGTMVGYTYNQIAGVNFSPEHPTEGYCALCIEYLDSPIYNCRDCPIALAGYPGCKNTPYLTAYNHWWDLRKSASASKPLPESLFKKWQAAAKKEIEFLESL